MNSAQRDFAARLARLLCVVIVIVWAASLAGCATTPTHEFCATANKISVACGIDETGKKTCRKYIDANHDYLTEQTEREILAHDEAYDRLCPKH